jgi:hypothetical protein
MNALVNNLQPAIFGVRDLEVMANAIAKSGLFGMKNTEQALALMLVAQAENQHPATITHDYDIIQGKACRKTHSVMARFQAAGGKVEWHELTDKKAEATFSHPSGGALRMAWTIEQAAKIGLTSKDNWKNYARAMLRARLIAEGVRAVYPAALGGMQLAEEAQDGDILPPTVREKDITPAQPEPTPPRTDEQFAAVLEKWAPHIKSGKKTHDDIIAFAESKAPLTDEQKAAIRAIKPPTKGEAPETVEGEQA